MTTTIYTQYDATGDVDAYHVGAYDVWQGECGLHGGDPRLPKLCWYLSRRWSLVGRRKSLDAALREAVRRVGG